MTRIEGERVTLREICEEDSELVVRWRNAERATRVFLSDSLLTVERQRKWVEAYARNPSDKTFIIEFEGRAAGMAALYDINDSSAEFGRLLIGEAGLRRQGIARHAAAMVLDYAFRVLGLATVRAEVYEDNRPALSLYRSLGFEAGAKRPGPEGRPVLCMAMRGEDWNRHTRAVP